jgi:hypothetical protein
MTTGATEHESTTLYAGGTLSSPAGQTGLAIWKNVSSALGAPDVTLTKGYPASATRISDLAIGASVLAVAAPDLNQVLLYRSPDQIASDVPPDAVLGASLGDWAPTRLAFGLAADNMKLRMYVVGRDGIWVFDDVAGTPTFVAKIQSRLADPTDLCLLLVD